VNDAEENGELIAPDELRDFAARFATGITILTTRDASGTPYGLTMNAVTCVCLDPPTFLACVDKSAATLAPLLESGVFALNILASDQQQASNTFASKGEDKFAAVEFTLGPSGVPLLAGALAAAEFRIANAIEAGDHVLVLGEATAADVTDAAPLLYYRGKYGTLAG
jgi:flavin reductase (DIM6/NTAB) family NADH-FMN oxidoreductase RutF